MLPKTALSTSKRIISVDERRKLRRRTILQRQNDYKMENLKPKQLSTTRVCTLIRTKIVVWFWGQITFRFANTFCVCKIRRCVPPARLSKSSRSADAMSRSFRCDSNKNILPSEDIMTEEQRQFSQHYPLFGRDALLGSSSLYQRQSLRLTAQPLTRAFRR